MYSATEIANDLLCKRRAFQKYRVEKAKKLPCTKMFSKRYVHESLPNLTLFKCHGHRRNHMKSSHRSALGRFTFPQIAMYR